MVAARPRITTMAANGPLPQAAAVLYPGTVMHARLRPFAHRFAYRVFSLLIDLDRLAEADRQSRLFSIDRANLMSFHQDDHRLRPGEDLRPMVDRLLLEAGVEERAARVVLLAYPRVLGYVFNPLSVFFAYDGAGRPLAVIYAVRNTFGQRHLYVAAVGAGEVGPEGIRQERSKLFHVSPFMGLEGRYHFRVLPPGQVVRIRIHETEDDQPQLAATFVGDQARLATRELASTLLRIPFMTWKVIAGIHWQAARLWLKGATFHPSPPEPERVSFHDAGRRLPQAADPEPRAEARGGHVAATGTG